MLQNAYLDAKIGLDPAENEPPKLGAAERRRSAGAHELHAQRRGAAGARQMPHARPLQPSVALKVAL